MSYTDILQIITLVTLVLGFIFTLTATIYILVKNNTDGVFKILISASLILILLGIVFAVATVVINRSNITRLKQLYARYKIQVRDQYIKLGIKESDIDVKDPFLTKIIN